MNLDPRTHPLVLYALTAARPSETDFGIAAIVLLAVIVLGYRLLRRDSGVRLTRIGVFLERERYHEGDDDEPDWPADDTRELPPSH